MRLLDNPVRPINIVSVNVNFIMSLGADANLMLKLNMAMLIGSLVKDAV